jgi:CBS domain-containing protein
MALMSLKIIHIGTETPVAEVTRLMVKHNIGRLQFLKGEKLIGIISRSDIIR